MGSWESPEEMEPLNLHGSAVSPNEKKKKIKAAFKAIKFKKLDLLVKNI